MKLETIKQLYRNINIHIFDGQLEEPVIRFFRARNKHGEYRQARGKAIIYIDRTIKLFEAADILYHEMVHQYESEILEFDNLDHGDTFLAHAWVADAMGWKRFI